MFLLYFLAVYLVIAFIWLFWLCVFLISFYIFFRCFVCRIQHKKQVLRKTFLFFLRTVLWSRVIVQNPSINHREKKLYRKQQGIGLSSQERGLICRNRSIWAPHVDPPILMNRQKLSYGTYRRRGGLGRILLQILCLFIFTLFSLLYVFISYNRYEVNSIKVCRTAQKVVNWCDWAHCRSFSRTRITCRI